MFNCFFRMLACMHVDSGTRAGGGVLHPHTRASTGTSTRVQYVRHVRTHPVETAGEAEDGEGARDLVVARERAAAVQAEALLGHLDASGRLDALKLRLDAHAQRALGHADLQHVWIGFGLGFGLR